MTQEYICKYVELYSNERWSCEARRNMIAMNEEIKADNIFIGVPTMYPICPSDIKTDESGDAICFQTEMNER